MLKNNLISLLDSVFPEINRLFSSPARADGSEKWVDFVGLFSIANVFPNYQKRNFHPNTWHGVENTGINSVSKKLLKFTLMQKNI